MNISLRQIEAFLAVARTLSFSEAARQCHLSQPALSATIKRLEGAINARLFDRHTRKVSLTAVGLEFFHVASGLADEFQEALSKVEDFVHGKFGRLVLAAAPSIASSFAPQVIAAFVKQNPRIQIELRDEMSDDCVDMVRQGLADIALTSSPTYPDDLNRTVLFRDYLAVIFQMGHPLSRLECVRWRDVQQYPQVVVNRKSTVRQLIDQEFSRCGVSMRPAFEVSQVGTLFGLASAGLGVGVLPELLLQHVNPMGLSQRRIHESKTSYRKICAITHRERMVPPAAAPFIQLCLQFAEQRALHFS